MAVTRGRREPSAGDGLRVFVMTTFLLLAVGVVAVGFAVLSGAAGWWALAAASFLVGGLGGWRAAHERRRLRATSPEHDLSRRQVALYGALALGLVLLALAIRGIGALVA